jgi:hypothetical protein
MGLAAVVAAGSGADRASAQGRLDARYVVTLAGIPIGKGAWVIDIADDQYTAAASGTTSGLLRVFASGQGSGASRGHIVGGNPVPASFAASVTTDRKTDEIRMTLSGGGVKDFAFNPPAPPNPERIPVTDAHRRNVQDPMTASFYRVPGKTEVIGPEACPRSVAVFDGRMRYDLKMAFKRVDQVKADKGYLGPAVVCSIQFVPIAGYIPHRAAIKYMENQREAEVWLAPVAGTRVMVPFRVTVPTPVGLGVMQATQFVATAGTRSAAGPRTQ